MTRSKKVMDKHDDNLGCVVILPLLTSDHSQRNHGLPPWQCRMCYCFVILPVPASSFIASISCPCSCGLVISDGHLLWLVYCVARQRHNKLMKNPKPATANFFRELLEESQVLSWRETIRCPSLMRISSSTESPRLIVCVHVQKFCDRFCLL